MVLYECNSTLSINIIYTLNTIIAIDEKKLLLMNIIRVNLITII